MMFILHVCDYVNESEGIYAHSLIRLRLKIWFLEYNSIQHIYVHFCNLIKEKLWIYETLNQNRKLRL